MVAYTRPKGNQASQHIIMDVTHKGAHKDLLLIYKLQVVYDGAHDKLSMLQWTFMCFQVTVIGFCGLYIVFVYKRK